jgi:hypothetical protein
MNSIIEDMASNYLIVSNNIQEYRLYIEYVEYELSKTTVNK